MGSYIEIIHQCGDNPLKGRETRNILVTMLFNPTMGK
jgi:hypothetical protein